MPSFLAVLILMMSEKRFSVPTGMSRTGVRATSTSIALGAGELADCIIAADEADQRAALAHRHLGGAERRQSSLERGGRYAVEHGAAEGVGQQIEPVDALRLQRGDAVLDAVGMGWPSVSDWKVRVTSSAPLAAQ